MELHQTACNNECANFIVQQGLEQTYAHVSGKPGQRHTDEAPPPSPSHPQATPAKTAAAAAAPPHGSAATLAEPSQHAASYAALVRGGGSWRSRHHAKVSRVMDEDGPQAVPVKLHAARRRFSLQNLATLQSCCNQDNLQRSAQHHIRRKLRGARMHASSTLPASCMRALCHELWKAGFL
eukprot:1157408-Pelagomonas_calceolata.AAC.11